MIEVEPVGPQQEAFYLECLNICFPGWGGPEMFDWAFRGIHHMPADLFFLVEDGKVVAGSALTYRQLSIGGGPPFKIACMTASWALPQARGKSLLRGNGLLGREVDISREIARDKGCAFLIAYMRRTNASLLVLARRGATIIPSAYFTFRPIEEDGALQPAAMEEMWMARATRPGHAGYHYGKAQWLEQFGDRPARPQAWRLPSGGMALLARNAGEDHLLALSCASTADAVRDMVFLQARSQRENRKLTGFTASAELMAALTPVADLAPGGIAVFPLSQRSDLAAVPWSIDSGDRM